jgi:hypothetical protein
VSSAFASPDFWYAIPFGERYRRVIEPTRLQRDLREELSRRAIGQNWYPPSYEIAGKGTWPDWMAYWMPLLSDKALSVLKELLEPHCEFLPWIKDVGHSYTLLNVTRKIPKANWSCDSSSVYSGAYAAADGFSILGVAIPHIFFLEGYQGKLFVSDALARASVEHALKGVAFVDPSIPEMHLPFIPFRFGRKGTGFVTREDNLPASSGRASSSVN